MKIVGVIPSRYASTRFPRKGISDICECPMLWWAYQSLKKQKVLMRFILLQTMKSSKMYVTCGIFLGSCHLTHLERLYEVSTKVNADFIFV